MADLRLVENRRETFLRFYAFHLAFDAHPGAVYYVLPELAKGLGLDQEQKLWLAYLNGNTQNPLTSYLLMEATDFLVPRRAPDFNRLKNFFSENYALLQFDTDRRHWKSHFVKAAAEYLDAVKSSESQVQFFAGLGGRDEEERFVALWARVRSGAGFHGFGRLSAWSYIEYLRIMGLPLQAPDLLLEDRDGSRSHRNGLCIVCGREDLDWHKSNPLFNGDYRPHLEWLKRAGEELLADARRLVPVYLRQSPWKEVDRARRARAEAEIGNLTLESALCTYKSWHRPRRRYANVYNDMFLLRIEKYAAGPFARIADLFMEIRGRRLPAALRLEETRKTYGDPGVAALKQDWYRLHGEVPMLGLCWPDLFPCGFENACREASRK